jgi:hypothetical protein
VTHLPQPDDLLKLELAFEGDEDPPEAEEEVKAVGPL